MLGKPLLRHSFPDVCYLCHLCYLSYLSNFSLMLSYWFYPNPGATGYGNPKIVALLILCTLLFAASFGSTIFRKRVSNPVTKRLMSSWPSALRWFSGLGFILVLSRAEGVQFLSIRALWVLWALGVLSYLAFQVWKFRLRHYTIVPREEVFDPREKYLPKAKKG